MKTVLVFGAFDGVHPGHTFFLKEAKKFGDQLVVCLARDTIVAELKGHPPFQGEVERREALAEDSSVNQVIYGDRELGTYSIIDEVHPDVIALGYDQTALKEDLERYLAEQGREIELIVIPSHHPELYKTSLLKPRPPRFGRNAA